MGPLRELLRDMSAGRSRLFLGHWLASEYFVSREFPRWLAGLMFQVSRPEHRHVIAENIWDEHGNGDFQRSHFMQCKAMVTSLGVPISKAPPPSAASYMDGVQGMVSGGLVPALAVIGAGNEYLIPFEYQSIWRHFEATGWTSAEMGAFFRSNLMADATHIEQLNVVLHAEVHSADRVAAFFAAADVAIALRLRFYHDLVDALPC